VIDSLNGYQAAMPEENSLILHIHELLQYLNPPWRRDLS
jgi:circadian clock protein KaiC